VSGDVEASPRPPYNAPPLPGSPAVVSSKSPIDFASLRRQALWVVVGQLVVAVNAALICYAVWGGRSSGSALIGGVIGAAATLAQVLSGMRGNGAGLIRGSAAKLVVTAVLLVVAMHIWPVTPEPLFLTYMATFLVYWLGLARTLRLTAQVSEGESLKGP
jgi:F0F1-type ATP synthase assembly protein I